MPTTILSILISLPYKMKRLYGQIAQNPADCGTSCKKIRSRNQNLYAGGSTEEIPTTIFRKICFIPYNFSRLSIFPAFSIFRPFFSFRHAPPPALFFIVYHTPASKLHQVSICTSPAAGLYCRKKTDSRRRSYARPGRMEFGRTTTISRFKTGRVCHGTDDAF